ncbi:MAG: MBL fold metallo-hydrolase, partial [Clostridium butyricum]|nr:MBL fold metallo-hydrolase [Clostridium butyricum]
KNIMIDTGLNSTKDNVVSQLKEKNIDSIDYLILTHMDKDHIGGADAILNEFKVDNVIQADYSKDSKQYNQYIKAIEKNNINPILIHDNINVKTDNAEINIYPALKKSYSQSNDYSIIVSINYGKYNFLFAGDAEEERLAEFINSNNEKYTLVKMPHHGKINSLSEKFIKSINPSYSIITCSDEELPDEDTIKLLNKYNVKNFLTKDGEIVVKTDGNNISISQ